MYIFIIIVFHYFSFEEAVKAIIGPGSQQFDALMEDLPGDDDHDDEVTESYQKPSHKPLDVTAEVTESIKSEPSTLLPPAINPHELYTQTPFPSQNYVAVSPGYPIWITPNDTPMVPTNYLVNTVTKDKDLLKQVLVEVFGDVALDIFK